MAGHIRKRERGSGVRYYPTLEIDGVQRTFGSFTSKGAAEKKLREVERKAADGTLDQENPTFAELADVWLESIKLEVKASAYDDYALVVRVHLNPTFGKTRIQKITTRDVDKFRTAKAAETRKDGTPYSARRVNKCLSVLGAIFRYAVDKKYLRESPVNGIKKLKVETEEMRYLTPGEIRRLLDASSPTLYPIVYAAVWTGLRQGELFGLKWSDVDLVNRKLTVRRAYHPQYGFTTPKSKLSRRKVDLSNGLVEVLTEHRAKTAGVADDLVFRNKAGNPVDYHLVTRRDFHDALDGAGLEHLRWHDLRHTYAALLIDQDVNVKRIQRLMGHADIGTTLNTYGHLLPDSEDGIGDKLDDLIYPDGQQETGGLRRVK